MPFHLNRAKLSLMNFTSQIHGFFQLLPKKSPLITSQILPWCIAIIAVSHMYPAIVFGADAPLSRENLTIYYSANNLGETEPGG